MDTNTLKSTLLVVEDEPQITAIVRRLIGRDYNLLVVSDVSEARRLMTESLQDGHPRIDGLLTDFNLPDGTGVEVIQAGRAAGITKIACMTAKAGNLSEIRTLSPNCIIEKPFDINAFRSTIAFLFKPKID